jgi:hypothetical protein
MTGKNTVTNSHPLSSSDTLRGPVAVASIGPEDVARWLNQPTGDHEPPGPVRPIYPPNVFEAEIGGIPVPLPFPWDERSGRIAGVIDIAYRTQRALRHAYLDLEITVVLPLTWKPRDAVFEVFGIKIVYTNTTEVEYIRLTDKDPRG